MTAVAGVPHGRVDVDALDQRGGAADALAAGAADHQRDLGACARDP